MNVSPFCQYCVPQKKKRLKGMNLQLNLLRDNITVDVWVSQPVSQYVSQSVCFMCLSSCTVNEADPFPIIYEHLSSLSLLPYCISIIVSSYYSTLRLSLFFIFFWRTGVFHSVCANANLFDCLLSFQYLLHLLTVLTYYNLYLFIISGTFVVVFTK